MIKLKLTDPTRKEKEIQEYVVNEQGFVALRKTSGLVYQSSVIQKWIDYAGNYDRKVDWEKIGIEHVFAIQEKGISALKSMQKAKQLIVKKVKSNSKIFINC